MINASQADHPDVDRHPDPEREISRYAPYEERRPDADRAAAPEGLLVRLAALADRDEVAALVLERDGGTLEGHRAGFETEVAAARPDLLLLVAEVEGRVAGWARARRFEHPPDPPHNVAPEGWYLSGVIVAPAFWRRGVGTELTRRRLEWIAARAGEAYCFIDADNRASTALHQRFGFVELTRDFTYPGVTFPESGGVLYRADLAGPGPR